MIIGSKAKFNYINIFNFYYSFLIVNFYNFHTVIDSMVFGRSAFGFKEFIPLEDLHDATNGYIVSDTCLLRVQITPLGKD